MDSIKDIELTLNLMQKLDSTRIYVGANICHHSKFNGLREELSKCRIFGLAPSTGAMNITSDELFQKTKELVLTTAELSK